MSNAVLTKESADVALQASHEPEAIETPSGGAEVEGTAEAPLDVRRILGLRVPVSVTLAERPLSMQYILEMTVGTIIEFDVPYNAPLTLNVANRAIAKGLAVKVGEKFGLRLTQSGNVQQRMDALGAGLARPTDRTEHP
jgi:flagellar motor switch protein FliN/FliY